MPLPRANRRCCAPRRLWAWAAALALLAPSAAAQDIDAYRELSGALNAVTAARQNSPAAALQQLNAADKAFAALAPTLQDRQLKETLATTLKRSKAALGQSPHALRAQTEYARALLRRALYDQTLTDLSQRGLQGDVASRLETLGAEFGLPEAAVTALLADAEAGHLVLVAARLQRQAANKVVGYLQPVAAGPIPYDSPRGYAHISSAGGWQLMLNGTQGLPDQSPAFQKVLALLARGGGQLAQPLVDQLYTGAISTQRALAQSFAAAQAAAQPTTPAVAATATQTAQSVPAQPSQAQPSGTDAEQRGQQGASPEALLGSVQTAQSAGVQARPILTTVNADGNVAAQATPTAPGKLTQVHTALLHALAESLQYNTAAARAELRAAAALLSAARLPDEYTAQQQVEQQRLFALAEQSSISTDEIMLRVRAIHALEQGKTAAPSPLGLLWSSSVQLGVFLVLALLAPLPAYLAFKAGGRQGRSWSQLAWGVASLVAPLVLEGIATLGLWLGDVTGVVAFNALGWLSVRRSPVGQVLWWALSFGGVVLLTLGFQSMSAVSGRVAEVRRNWNVSRHTRVEGSETTAGEAAAKPSTAKAPASPAPPNLQRREKRRAAQATRAGAAGASAPPRPASTERQEALARLAGRLGNERLRRLAAGEPVEDTAADSTAPGASDDTPRPPGAR